MLVLYVQTYKIINVCIDCLYKDNENTPKIPHYVFL